MPRRRLCLGFYVCDLEFGICPTICLFILLSSRYALSCLHLPRVLPKREPGKLRVQSDENALSHAQPAAMRSSAAAATATRAHTIAGDRVLLALQLDAALCLARAGAPHHVQRQSRRGTAEKIATSSLRVPAPVRPPAHRSGAPAAECGRGGCLQRDADNRGRGPRPRVEHTPHSKRTSF